METYKAFLCLYLLFTLAGCATSQNLLEQFIRDKLDNYSNWIRSKNLDPSPFISGPTNISFATVLCKVECTLSHHLVQQHSQSINVTSVKADLESITVSFAVQNNVTFLGQYVANGTTWSSEFSGQGHWNITFPGMNFKNFEFKYSIASPGHIDITSYDLDGFDVPDQFSRKAEVFFENLWEDEDVIGDQNQIKDALYGGFREYLINEQEHPIKQMYLDYFQEIFANTSWADIIVPQFPDPTNEGDTTTPVQITSPTGATGSPSTTTPKSPATDAADIANLSSYLLVFTMLKIITICF